MKTSFKISIVFLISILPTIDLKSGFHKCSYDLFYQNLDSCDIKTYLLVKGAVERALINSKYKELDEMRMYIRFSSDFSIKIWNEQKDSIFNSEITNYILREYDSCTTFEIGDYGVPYVFVVPIKIRKGVVSFH